jgi:acyl-CoA synthetase (AMP-forming)/AMP-acid ligase II
VHARASGLHAITMLTAARRATLAGMYWTQGLHRGLQQTPSAPATIFGDRVRTFADQADRVARLAGALRELGVSDGERVGILALNSDRVGELLLAVPWANGVLVPVNARWSPTEVAYALRDAEVSILFVDEPLAGHVPTIRESHPDLATIIQLGDGYEDLIAGGQPVDDARRCGDSLAAILYTGGTTGFPKGVMLSHANLVTSTIGALATVQTALPGGRTLLALPTFHVAAIATWMLQSVAGGTHVILPTFDPAAVLAAIATHRITSTTLVPTMLQQVVDHPALAEHDVSSLRSLIYAASPISEALLERAMRALPDTGFTQAYGMTELAPITTMLDPIEHAAGTHLRSVGRAAAHAEVRVVDDKDNEVPRGTIGEIICRGGNVMLGYWNQPELTAEALRGGWMHTGDAGYMDGAGYLYVVDRLKDMIITDGSNVYSTEVENAISSHPAVAGCAVIGVPDQTLGERVHAVIVCAPGHEVTAEQIREHCQRLIAGYKAPRSCDFVAALPVSPAGKVLKHELRKPYWEGMSRQVH